MNRELLVRVIEDGVTKESHRILIGDAFSPGATLFSETIRMEIAKFQKGNTDLAFHKYRVGSVGYTLVFERVTSGRSLVVFGAGHVGRSVALLGLMLGMDVFLVDDREDFLQEDLIPLEGIHRLKVRFDDLSSIVSLNKRTAVVIVTRGHQFDEQILMQLADYETGYIGMIGSKRRIEGIFRRLKSKGVSEMFLVSVKAPIGLEIGAASPQEIAVAIHAQIIKQFSGKEESDNK